MRGTAALSRHETLTVTYLCSSPSRHSGSLTHPATYPYNSPGQAVSAGGVLLGASRGMFTGMFRGTIYCDLLTSRSRVLLRVSLELDPTPAHL